MLKNTFKRAWKLVKSCFDDRAGKIVYFCFTRTIHHAGTIFQKDKTAKCYSVGKTIDDTSRSFVVMFSG